MKKKFLVIATVALSGSILLPSCIGSFALSNKFLAWNKTIDSKFVNEILFVIFTPAYAITMLADVLVLNSVEFWSGTNPVEAGIIKTVQGENGVYTVETLENGYNIKNENGEEMELIYNKEDNSWSMVQNDEATKLFKYTDDNSSAIVYLPNGAEQKVELSADGVLALRQAVNGSLYYAMK
ncbi:MAG: DUF3332 domain-containing protein [Dysgonomonas sp.]